LTCMFFATGSMSMKLYNEPGNGKAVGWTSPIAGGSLSPGY
jgi:hypothetical protein